jgi:hypothetical protein
MSGTATIAPQGVREFTPPRVQNYSKYPEGKGYMHRLVDTRLTNKRGDRVSHFLNQGWEIAPYGNEGMKRNRDTGARSDDGAVHYRGLVLMRIKESIGQQRNEYYRGKHERLLAASEAVRQMANLANNRKRGDSRTSAFAESVTEKTRGGRRTTIQESSFDSAHPTEERIMRDVDPRALQELKDRLDQMQAQQEKVEADNRLLRQELAERQKRPSERKRRSFSVTQP